MKIRDLILGKKVSADHPITVLNPAKIFEITEVNIFNKRIYVKGKNTMWFDEGLIDVIKEDTP